MPKPRAKTSARPKMGTAKKAAAKTRITKAAAVDPAAQNKQHAEIWGIVLLAMVLVTVVSVVSEYVAPGAGNLLGPYLGHFWARSLSQSFGNLPLVLLLIATAHFAFKLILHKESEYRWRTTVTLFLLFLAAEMLLSIKHVNQTNLSALEYQLSGGWLGNYLVQRVLRSIFGTHTVGLYFALSLVTFFITLFGFKIQISKAVETVTEALGILIYPAIDGWQKAGHRYKAKVERVSSNQLDAAEPAEKLGKDKKEKVPPNMAKNMASGHIGAEDEDSPEILNQLRPLGKTPFSIDNMPELNRKLKKKRGRDFAKDHDETLQQMDPPELIDSQKNPEEPAITITKEELDEIDPNDPFAVRKYRDLLLQKRRVQELNEWEVKSRNPEIGGMLDSRDSKEAAGELGAGLDSVSPLENGSDEPNALESVAASKKSSRKRSSNKKVLSPSSIEGEEQESVNKKSSEESATDDLFETAEEHNTESDSEFDNSENDLAESMDADMDLTAAPDSAESKPSRKRVKKGLRKIVHESKNASGGGVEGAKPKQKADGAQKAPAPPPPPEVKYDPYVVPKIDDLFEVPPEQPVEFTEEELREQSELLEAQLVNFKVLGKVTHISPGPVVTRFEVELAPGIKVSKIANLGDDLALALRAKRIRILAPIPGKSVVGIEVPNRKPQIVYIKDILESSINEPEDDKLKIVLGKKISGDPYVTDLARAPHLLIAGQTGSGKSVCINAIMASLLTSKSPDELRLLLVDPKVVELKPYDSIPHLLYPVITQPETAVQALKWATIEMDRRYEVLAMSGARNIKGFNERVRDGRLVDKLPEEDNVTLPYIIIIIDELADLMMVAGKEVETSIARIAQKARAVGIHLILATQRPSTNVITGTIKANLPTRIAFQVASQIDARTIMDKAGAERLLGRGDMLFRPIDSPDPLRVHGAFVDDDQAETVANACSEQHVNYPQIQSFDMDSDADGGAFDDEPRDEKFRDAAELVVSLGQGSVSLLQRRLGIGYARSGRIVDQLERAGIVGKERGSKPREVLMNEEELMSFLSAPVYDD